MSTSRLVKKLCACCLSGARSLNHAIAGAGLVAVMVVFMQVGTGRLADDASADDQAGAPGQTSYEGLEAPVVEPVAPEQPKYRALANYLSKRYRVAEDATEHLVGVAFDAGHRVGLDPLLILAVMAVESSLNPIAESENGAKGLMQIIPGYHKDKLDAANLAQSVLDPMTNVLVGARILKEYIGRTGSLESGLQFYAGALSDTSSQYAQKVMAVQERLRQAASRQAASQRPITKSPAA